ncbi:MAG: dihydrolipoamide acetyltransferase family protein [Acidimicrobiales bacterium]
MIEITMPRLSDTMEEGTIATWHKHPGDAVAPGDVLVEIETDKATMEYEAYEAGTLAEILVPEGETVAIGTPIAQLDNGRASASAAASTSAPSTSAITPVRAVVHDNAASVAPTEETAQRVTPVTGERLIASPLVRKVAREHHLDLTGVRGSGPGGRIVRRDLDALLTSELENGAPTTPAPRVATSPSPVSDDRRGSRTVEMSSARRVIARRLGESARTIPHFFVTAVADADALVRVRAELNAQLGAVGRPTVSINDLLIRACALALRDHPTVNASYIDDASTTMLIHDRVNIGVAVASPHGLVVPVITDADTKTLAQLGAEAKSLAALAHDKKLSLEQMSGGTFTISNLGMFGVEQFTAIINPPEGAILAVGATRLEPTVVDGAIVARPNLRYTLSADHRIIDGALAAQFLRTLTTYVENPWSLVV